MAASNDCDLSIIMVSYNSREFTLAALESFYAHAPDLKFEMLIVDNDSSDGSAAAIAASFPQARLSALKTNLGFAAANNLAAQSASGRRLLLLNPDTVHLDDATGALWRFAERTPDRGIWGGRTLYPDRSLNPTSCWGRMTVWSLFCFTVGLSRNFRGSALFDPEGYGGWRRDTERDVDIVTGCFLMIDRALWERLGAFDKTFFMYAEEADLCLRAIAAGARPGISPEATIIHYGGVSEASRTEKVIKVMRGKATLMHKHWPRPKLMMGLALLWLWSLSRVVYTTVAAREDRPKWLTIWHRRREWMAGFG